MLESVIQIMRVCLPILLVSFIILFVSTIRNPQRLRNSFFLMHFLMWLLITIAGLFGDDMGMALLVIFLICFVALLLVPGILILNGIIIISKERFSLANALSLLLGIGIGLGEIAVFYSVISASWESRFAKPTAMFGGSAIYFSFVILAFVLYSIFVLIIPRRKNFDYIIIHGCGIREDGSLSVILQQRVDKAIQVYRKCKKKPIFIPSGGKGEDEIISEAMAMKNYLVTKGIDENHILLEDQSKTTMENLMCSKELVQYDIHHPRIALVSSNYHIYRCVTFAKQIGMNCVGIGSKVALYYWPSALLRECVAVYTKKKKLIPLLLGWLLLMYMLYII